jgi:hypothetical protein
MRPDRHVVRVRKKLPGHHNRRFKGKNREVDRQRRLDQERAESKNGLIEPVKARLAELQVQAPGHPLIEAAVDVLVAYSPRRPPQMWLSGETFYLVFRRVYVELDLCPEGVRADCFTDFDEEIETFYSPLSVASWLRRVVKT